MVDFLNIKTRADLCNFLGISDERLRFYCHAETKKLYSVFLIPKKNGNYRTIYKPQSALRIIQFKLKETLESYAYFDKSNFAFCKGKNVVQGAELHQNKKFVISFDLVDFFETIHIGRIIGLFLNKPFNFSREIAVILAQLVTADKKLIQGSPCSPILSNMIFYNIDKQIRNYIRGKNIVYSRYADDLTFSFDSKHCIDLFLNEENKVCENFKQLIESNRFTINDSKTRMRKSNRRQIVTGIIVNKTNSLKIEYRKSIRGFLHSLETFGVDKTLDFFCKKNSIKASEKTKKFMFESYRGKIAYIGMVKGKNNNQYICLANRLNCFIQNKFKNLVTENLKTIKENCVFSVSGPDNNLSLGSGFAYKNHIITCSHVVKAFDSSIKVGSIITCYNVSKRQPITCTIIGIDEENDLAILKPTSKVELISIMPISKTEQCEDIIACGYPDYNDADSNYNNTIYGKYQTKQKYHGKTYYVFDASMQQGVSGGAVLNFKNHVFAYVVYGSEKREESKLNNGSLSISVVDNFIDSLYKNI